MDFKTLCEEEADRLITDCLIDLFADGAVSTLIDMHQRYIDRYGKLAGSMRTKRLQKKMVNRVLWLARRERDGEA